MWEFSSRDGLAALGVAAVFSARHFYRKKMLRPFQASVIVAWPSIGVAIMQTVISNSTPRTLEELSSKGHTDEEVAKSREASAVLRERLRHLAASQQAEDSSSSSSKA